MRIRRIASRSHVVLVPAVRSGGTHGESSRAAQVKTAGGLVQGTTVADGAIRVFNGIPYAAPPVGTLRWQPPQPVVPWTGVRDATKVGPGLHAGQAVRRHHPAGPQRRLPDVEHPHAGERRDGSPAGDGLDPRRRIHGGRRLRTAPRRPRLRPQGHRPRHDQLPAWRVRLPGASGADGRVGPACVRQLRDARPGRGAAVGARQHRGVWRRPAQRDHLRRIGRIVRRQRADGVAAGAGPVPQGHWRKWRVLHGRVRNAGVRAPRRGRAAGREVRHGGRSGVAGGAA